MLVGYQLLRLPLQIYVCVCVYVNSRQCQRILNIANNETIDGVVKGIDWVSRQGY